ncbi:nicotinic acid mononucleotide adenylyltransferase [Spiribacter salinus M19-40]|uniref:Probable nicotinate-nucleotide adenylyltransferase n=1 Tax=Spiribacter salinus M19-40 TaxID=1260251 RepID=R4VM52_9GAMM|nr:nicotinate-nucleotide adenylyltransferase [Spiribacter salinus]AGM41542.1 nicotinic acid mononucleotide adenylyltransferase [Spiribacter salinus M19-40]
MSTTAGAPVALLGGTFDPVHYGHIRPAIELLEGLGLSELRLVPGRVPPHRPQPRLDAQTRTHLLHLAVANIPGLVVDERELQRAGPSYTSDTLQGLRRELGPERPLCFAMGSDAFRSLPHWHRWQTLAEQAHLVVTTRGGDSGEPLSPELAEWLAPRQVQSAQALRSTPAGRVLFHPVSRLEISATGVRRLMAQGRSARGLMPDPVWEAMADAGLYGYPQQ